VALVTVTTGTVVLSGPDGRHPMEAGRSVLATPAGVQKVEAGESMASVRQVRDELLRSLTAREEKNRGVRAEVEALQSKVRKGKLPPGATLESLIAGLRAALAKGDPAGMKDAIDLLGLLLEQDAAAFEGVIKMLHEARDSDLAHLLCSAMWQAGASRVHAHRTALLKLFLASEIPIDVRAIIVQSLRPAFYGNAKVGEADGAQLLRAAQALAGSGTDVVTLRSTFVTMAVQQMSAPSEAWSEFQRYLASETDDGIRRAALRNYFQGTSRRRGSPAPETLLMETLRGRYGPGAIEDQIRAPLLSWFTPENADDFVGSLKQAASQLTEPAQRQSAAGQLGLLHLIQRHPAALDALRQLHAAETDEAVRSRLGDVLQAGDKGTLDLDKLMDKLQLQWNF